MLRITIHEDGKVCRLGRNASTRYLEVWAYCLMPNHVHLILNPRQADGLGRAVGEAHRRYTNFIHARGRWTGHLFQSRFASAAMDESHPVWSFGDQTE
jgi:putative transposase